LADFGRVAELPGVARETGPYSRALSPRRIDRRTAIGRHVAAFERGLIEHAGGKPSLPMRALIDQAVSIELQLTLLERKGIDTDHDRRCYASWLNGKRLTLKAIGFSPAAEKPPSLADYLREKEAAATEAAA
jgi:hypothetical protein